MGQCPCAGESAPPVVEAARDDNLEELKRLVANGEDINQTDEVSAPPAAHESRARG